jgi:drug/metabolite transporter (DMT)-like permease
MTKPAAQIDSNGVYTALWAVALVGVVAVTVAAFVAGTSAALGVALGASLAAANLWAMGVIVRNLLGKRRGAPWGILGALKILALFAVTYVIVRVFGMSPLPLLIGYGALPIGIVAAQFRSAPAREET